MAEPNFHEKIERTVSSISNSGNPIVKDDSWNHDVVVITDDETNIEKGETVEFVIKKKQGKHYQALLSHQTPVSKPNYRSSPNIPIHHDGKHNQSVGDTRSESHAMRSVEDRY